MLDEKDEAIIVLEKRNDELELAVKDQQEIISDLTHANNILKLTVNSYDIVKTINKIFNK